MYIILEIGGTMCIVFCGGRSTCKILSCIPVSVEVKALVCVEATVSVEVKALVCVGAEALVGPGEEGISI